LLLINVIKFEVYLKSHKLATKAAALAKHKCYAMVKKNQRNTKMF